MSVREERIKTLLMFFGVRRPNRDNERSFLLGLGKTVAEQFFMEPNFREVLDKKELTAPGLSMAHDMGLLVAELIIESAEGAVKWTLFKKTRRALEYNLPVLIGRPPKMILDPVGGSLTEAKAMLRRGMQSEIWGETYSFWLERFTNETPMPAWRILTEAAEKKIN